MSFTFFFYSFISLSSDPATMENHRILLNTKCRACNGDTDKSYPLGAYVNIIKVTFGVDIAQDEEMVHPRRLCNSCKSTLYKLKISHENGKTVSTSLTMHTFKPHDDNCSLCFPSSSSNTSQPPKKKAKSGPGRGKRSATVLSAHSEPVESESTQHVSVQTEGDVDGLVCSFNNISVEERSVVLRNLVDQMSLHEKSVMARLLGQSQADSLKAEASALRGEYKQLNNLQEFDINRFVSTANIVTRSFIEGACQVGSVGEHNSTCTYIFACLIDMIYKLRVPSIITPLSFMKNLTTFVSNDRRWICKLNAVTSPGGSYTTISDWLKLQSQTSEPVAPEGDILNVFDNDQVIGKTFTVKPNNKVNMSIITNRAWIPIDASSNLQGKEDFMPGKWMGEENQESFQQAVHLMMSLDKSNPLFRQYDELHREQQTAFLFTALQEVKEEQVVKEGGITDVIDQTVEKAELDRLYIKCQECQELVLKRSKKCNWCKKDMTKSRKVATEEKSAGPRPIPKVKLTEVTNEGAGKVDREERYPHIQSRHPDEPVTVTVADPVFCNPNSFDSLITVLRKIGKDAGIHRYGGDKRFWTVVCCDGLPYHLCMKLVDVMLTCTLCQSSFFGEEALRKHFASSHNDQSPEFYREFDWVLLRIGAGHYEMNMIKAFTELNWQPFLSDLCRLLSFKSPAAQQSAKRCDSHHKAWAVVLAFFLGSLKELVLDYVRGCLLESHEPTPQGYIDYAKSKRHIPNFWYMHEQVLVYGLAILTFRMGIRRNNNCLVSSAKDKFKGIFFGRHHPIYAQIEVHDTLQRMLFPKPVEEQLSKAASFSTSGNKSKGQDADFVLEEVNKDSKSWISRGVPDDMMWLTVCRNLDGLKKVKNKVKSLTNTQAPSADAVYRVLDVSASVEAWRCRLRQTGYLQGTNSNHTSISGEALHPDLNTFKISAEAKRSNRIATMYLNRPPNPQDCHPVFINDEEARQFNSVEKKTVAEIKKLIDDGIRCLIESEDDQVYLLSKYSKIRKKADFISLYHEIQSLHKNQISHPDADEELD